MGRGEQEFVRLVSIFLDTSSSSVPTCVCRKSGGWYVCACRGGWKCEDVGVACTRVPYSAIDSMGQKIDDRPVNL